MGRSYQFEWLSRFLAWIGCAWKPDSLILVVINTNFHRLEQFLPSANVTNPFTINSSLCGCSNIHCFANKSSIFYTCLRTLYVVSSDVKQRRIEIKQILCCLEIFSKWNVCSTILSALLFRSEYLYRSLLSFNYYCIYVSSSLHNEYLLDDECVNIGYDVTTQYNAE